eukprot:snap_masked-scaffold131_size323982-processed-gene-1.3 protein:Tk05546 transcript:snap_masked-scaffold131_size323982-processed-gene-1.3-mRNA-1 annotation:"ecdysteroid receptor -b"
MAMEIPTDPANSSNGEEVNRKSGVRARVCFVCGVNTKSYHLNYGVSTCLGCRAFFRRSVQADKGANYRCKNVGICDVTGGSRKKCRKCRYKKCLSAGMDPNCVLSDDQKKQRFKRSIKRKKRQEKRELKAKIILEKDSGKQRTPSMTSCESSLGSIGSVGSPETLIEAEAAPDPDPKILFKKKLIKQYEHEASTSSTPDSGHYGAPILLEAEVRAAWNSALGTMQTSQSKHFLQDFFIRIHNGEIPLTHSRLTAVANYVVKMFRTFAGNLTAFKDLSLMDQCTLLQNNSSKFLSFVFAMYFGEANGPEQLAWLFWDSHPPSVPLRPIRYADLSRRQSDQTISDVSRLLDHLSLLRFSSDQIPTLAACSLFSVEHSVSHRVSDMAPIKDAFQEANSWCSMDYLSGMRLQDILSELSCIMFNGQFRGPNWNIPHTQNFSLDQETWLTETSEMLLNAMAKVPIGSDMLDHLLDVCSSQLPIPSDTLEHLLVIFKNKFQSLFRIPEFGGTLPSDVVNLYLDTTLPSAFSLTFGHMKSKNGLLDSLSIFMSHEERFYLKNKITSRGTKVGPLLWSNLDRITLLVLENRIVRYDLNKMPSESFLKDHQLYLGMLVRVLSCPLSMDMPQSRFLQFCEQHFLACAHRFEVVTNSPIRHLQDSVAALKLSYGVSFLQSK